MAYKGTPEKMTSAEYRKLVAYQPKSWRNGVETILAAFEITEKVLEERANDPGTAVSIMENAGYKLSPVDLSAEVNPGFPVTVAVMAKKYLPGSRSGVQMILVTEKGMAAFRNGYAADTDISGAYPVRRRITAAYAVTPLTAQ